MNIVIQRLTHVLKLKHYKKYVIWHFQVITELKSMWPTLALVHGKPRHPQSQGSVERANGDIKDMLVAWMSDQNSQDWSVGIKFVQFQKNAAYHSGIKCSPYSALLGCEARVGLTSSSLPTEVVSTLETEEDLKALLVDKCESESIESTDTENDSVTATDTEIEMTDFEPEASDINTESAAQTVADSEKENTHHIQDSNTIEIAKNGINIRKRRASAADGQHSQAERMVKRSKVEMKAGDLGDNVAVPIPLVDRGRGDPRNILGVIIDRDLSSDTYTIAVKAGILKGKYTRNQFDLCPQHLLQMSDVNENHTVSLREAVSAESCSGGQGFTKCNCSGVNRCKSNRCKCFKLKLLCNSKCHGSLTCTNK